MFIKIIGGGLAGCEAAHYLATRGYKVKLYEMKPKKFSPVHKMDTLCELVCSNSLKAERLDSAGGLLKKEMELFGSVICSCAAETRVPAGGALAVDRELFSRAVTEKLKENPNIEIINEEITEIDENCITIIAAGPLVSDGLSQTISNMTGGYMNFYDAVAPIVTLDSIDMDKAFFGARYGRGGDDYINCPMTEDEYNTFYDLLVNAETAPLHEGVESPGVFEGCMPVEVMAKRGRDTLTYGPLKPVGLRDKNGNRPYAVVQLRQDNAEGTLFNIVGFQTNLKWGEQKKVFSQIPALHSAEFVRYGVMHRNSFIDSPKLLGSDFSMREHKNIFFAGQITGVEGYVESAASGIMAAMGAAARANGKILPQITPYSIMGALSGYISGGSVGKFQPMNANFGILPPLGERIRDKKERYTRLAERSLAALGAQISGGEFDFEKK